MAEGVAEAVSTMVAAIEVVIEVAIDRILSQRIWIRASCLPPTTAPRRRCPPAGHLPRKARLVSLEDLLRRREEGFQVRTVLPTRQALRNRRGLIIKWAIRVANRDTISHRHIHHTGATPGVMVRDTATLGDMVVIDRSSMVFDVCMYDIGKGGGV